MSSRLPFIALAALGLSALACGRGAAPANPPAEPPPPPMETELAPGSRLVEPRVQELMRRMSDRLGQVSALALEAEEIYDEVPADRPRTQLMNVRHVAMRRPDRLAADASGDAQNRAFCGSGTLHDGHMNKSSALDVGVVAVAGVWICSDWSTPRMALQP